MILICLNLKINRSRNPGVDMSNYGLFLLYSPGDKENGFFMSEDRTISSFELDFQVSVLPYVHPQQIAI